MEKNIMTFDELMAFGEKHGVNSCYMRSRVQQNAVEISMNILAEMAEYSGLSRSSLIDLYIEKWSREAEVEWLGSNYEANSEYIDFIDAFSKRKLEEFKQERFMQHSADERPKKKAKLVMFTLTTRVVVDENEMPECEDEDAIEKALEKIKANPEDYLVLENFDDIYDDEDCPYGSLDCDKEEE